MAGPTLLGAERATKKPRARTPGALLAYMAEEEGFEPSYPEG